MKITFYHKGNEREKALAEAFCSGARIFAHKADAVALERFSGMIDSDVVCVIGVKSFATKIVEAAKAQRATVLLLDKGHFHRRKYTRVAINAFMPNHYLEDVAYPLTRWKQLNLSIKEMKLEGEGDHIVYAGSSDKYSWLRGLGGATAYANFVIDDLKRRTNKEIVYRPKPSWEQAVPIDGTRFSRPPTQLQDELKDAYALVTHGSNAACEALLHGIPAIVLGDGAARPLAATSVQALEQELPRPSVEEREQWFSKLAYCQWTHEEFRSGKAWEVIHEQMEHPGTGIYRF